MHHSLAAPLAIFFQLKFPLNVFFVLARKIIDPLALFAFQLNKMFLRHGICVAASHTSVFRASVTDRLFLILLNTRSRRWELNPRPTPYHGVALPLSYFGTKDRMIVLLLNVTHSHVRPAASATPLSRGMVLRSRFARARNARSEQPRCSSPAELRWRRREDKKQLLCH